MITPALKAAIKKVNDEYGEGTISLLGSGEMVKVERLETGLKPLDDILGGGLPRSSIIELYGEPSSGKSTLAQIIVALLQKKGYTAAYFDAEHGLEEKWMRRFGINLEDLIWSQPDYAEQVIDASTELIKAGIDLIIIDSVAAFATKEELEGVEEEGIEDKKMALLARLMHKTMRVQTTLLKNRKTILIYINQFTTNIGGTASFYGVPMKTKGGLALKQYSRVRLEVIRTEWIESDAAKKHGVKWGRIGAKIEVRVAKSKVSPPFRFCVLSLPYYTKDQLKKMGVKTK